MIWPWGAFSSLIQDTHNNPWSSQNMRLIRIFSFDSALTFVLKHKFSLWTVIFISKLARLCQILGFILQISFPGVTFLFLCRIYGCVGFLFRVGLTYFWGWLVCFNFTVRLLKTKQLTAMKEKTQRLGIQELLSQTIIAWEILCVCPLRKIWIASNV